MKPEQDLEKIIENTEPTDSIKEKVVDTVGNITYSLMVGSALDYCSGLNCSGIITSRASATAMNAATGAPYGMWRNLLYRVTKTDEKSGAVRKFILDLVAFNSFQLPIYAIAIGAGSRFSEGEVNWEKVRAGAEYLAMISPIIGPTLGWYMDGIRKLFGMRSASQKVNKYK